MNDLTIIFAVRKFGANFIKIPNDLKLKVLLQWDPIEFFIFVLKLLSSFKAKLPSKFGYAQMPYDMEFPFLRPYTFNSGSTLNNVFGANRILLSSIKTVNAIFVLFVLHFLFSIILRTSSSNSDAYQSWQLIAFVEIYSWFLTMEGVFKYCVL